jgi:hypothetical protein
LVASRIRLISIFIISARLALNAAKALFNAIGTSEANRSKSIIDKQEQKESNVNYLENHVLMEIPLVMVWQLVVPRLFPMFLDRVIVHDKQNHYLYVLPLLL